MDINLTPNLNVQQLLAALKTPALNLKLNQQVEAKLVSANIVNNTLTLAFGENTIETQAKQTLPPQVQLPAGAIFTLQVVRLMPQPEFKLLTITPNSASLANVQTASSTSALLTTPGLTANTTSHTDISSISRNNLPQNQTSPPQPVATNKQLNSAPPELQLKLLKITPQTQAALVMPNPNASTQNPTLSDLSNSKTSLSHSTTVLNTPAKTTSPTNTALPEVTNKGNIIFTANQALNAKIVATDGKTIQLEFNATPTTTNKAPVTAPISTDPATTNTKSSSTTTTPVTTVVISVALKDLKLAQPPTTPSEPNKTHAPLNISNQQASLPFKVGTVVQLQVTQSQGKTEFTIQPSINTQVEAQHIHNALREQLPKQASPLHLLQQLTQQLPELQQNQTVSETLKQLAQKILQTLPNAQSLSDPSILKQSISDVGVFLEAKLAHTLNETAQELTGDLKANLLKLHINIKESVAQTNHLEENLKPTAEALPDLQQKTEHALAKIVLDQLASLPKDDSNKQIWHLEIPYTHNEQLQKLDLSIERDTSGTSSNEQHEASNWSVTLNITPPGLDTIHCKIIFANNTINTYFRSENSQTCVLIKENVDYLRAQFEANALTPGHMDAHIGNFSQNMQDKLQPQNLFYAKV